MNSWSNSKEIILEVKMRVRRVREGHSDLHTLYCAIYGLLLTFLDFFLHKRFL